MAIHIGVLILIFQLHSAVKASLRTYTATTLFVTPLESVPAVAPRPRPPKVLPPVLPGATRPRAIEPIVKTPAPRQAAADLPAPPDLAVTRKVPDARPPLSGPAPPAPSPAFASALSAAPPTVRTAAPRTGSFGTVPTAGAPATAKLQIVGDTFRTVPADTPHGGPAAAHIAPAGFGAAAATTTTANPNREPPAAASNAFGAAAVTAASPHRGPSVASSNGFGGVAPAAPPPEAASKPKNTGTAFSPAVAADPARQPVATHRPAAEPLEILFKPRPDYTEEARRARLEGDVMLEVLFPASGSLRVLRVLRGLGHGLDQTAVDAAARIRFRPATEDGRPVDTIAMIRISFQMAY